MKKALTLGLVVCFTGAAGNATSADSTLLPDGLHIQHAHCQIGTGGLYLDGNADGIELARFLAQVADARDDSIGSMLAARAAGGLGKGRGGGEQVVYLEFNPGEPDFPVLLTDGNETVGVLTFPDYIYTQEDKDFIQSKLEEDYALYKYEFTQERPTRGEYSTLTFGENDNGNIRLNVNTGGLNILFGRAENIDFLNEDRSDNAFVDASLWRFLAELDRINGTNNLGALSGLTVDGPGDIDAVEQLAVRNQSANTGAHELGHIQGLRHHDSIGAPGDGLPPAVLPDDYLPVGETEQNAFETYLHTMASGASVGLPIWGSTAFDRFFGERSAVKFAVNRRGPVRAWPEAFARNELLLSPLRTPNPLVDGVNAGARLETRAALIDGRLDTIGEVDGYRFSGNAGEVFNAELISWSDLGVAEPIIGLLVLSQVEADGARTELVRNRLTFEGIEPMIIDFELPEAGDYVLEVSSPPTIDFGGGVIIPLDAFGLGGFEVGDYDLHAYIVEAR